ncbi:MAG: hypothetical protein OXF33_03165 [Rhodospirillales bacterium]|nr:hypothetical protein [Rhodospirillales bacterium]
MVRELVQNALDAAIAAERDVVRVIFEMDEIRTKDVPALAEYREHLECAIDTQRKKRNLEQAQAIVDAMKASATSKRLPVLWVLDNGIGLDSQGMEDLLGDGQSGKADEWTAGSYGNGHMTTFPASDPRYILYGGVHQEGRTVAGHAILASHVHQEKACGEDGYLARDVRTDVLFDRFDFYDGSTMPLLKGKLDRIEQEFGTGSIVGVLGFNRFNRYQDDQDVLEAIETVVATHFTPVIRDERMVVTLCAADGVSRDIDAAALETILERRSKRERRDRNSIGPSGRQAWETLQTIASGDRHMIDTRAGTVRLHIRELPAGAGGSRVQFFRNGMWITNDVPHNRASDYRDVVPFNAAVLLEPHHAKEACRLVGKFEGPRHIDIVLSREARGSAGRRALDAFLEELHNHVLRLVRKIDVKEFDPGFFSVEVTGDGIRKNPRARAPAGTGTPEPAPRPHARPTTRSKKRKRRPGPKVRFRREGRRIDAHVVAVRRTRGLRLRAKPLDDAANAELRVVIANGSDETCDSPEPDQFLEIGDGATVGGEAVKGYVPDQEGKHRAVLLGPLSATGEELEIWLPCRLAAATGSLNIELIRRADPRKDA